MKNPNYKRGAYVVLWTEKRNLGFNDDYRPFNTYEKAVQFYNQIKDYPHTWTVHLAKTLDSTDYS